MQKLGLNEIRKRFQEFFESKGHYVAPSHSVVPTDDNSLLLINSGMAPLKNYFSGVEVPPKNRMSTCQKCIRTGDIENVGVTARHATFFEMMGNFSFGDYFKEDAINYAWEFITKWLNIPEDKLWITVYENDDEAFDLWVKNIKFPKERMVRLGKDDNFWEIGLGPCGPCSEIYFDKGEKYGCGDADCKPGCDCDRFLEFWNLVFTQFDKQEDGSYKELDQKNIDTGMGLERMGCIMQEVDTIFEVDTIRAILDQVCEMSKKTYGENSKNDMSIRIVTDHIRAVSFMVSDGILPSNEGRGYVLRRLLRRAARHGKLLGLHKSFLYKLVDIVISVSGAAYPELKEKEDYIKKVITIEEEKFTETLAQGLEILESYVEEMKNNKEKQLKGELAFKLYDTYGFPVDLTKEILEEEKLTVDEDGFEEQMQLQKQRARKARGNREDEAWAEDPISKVEGLKTEFKGYENVSCKGQIKAIVCSNELVTEIAKGQKGEIVLNETVFYANSGGQVGDKGSIFSDNAEFIVEDTVKGPNGNFKHIGFVKKGQFKVEEIVNAEFDKFTRLASGRNHTATHLLHHALRTVLGSHVNQAGSLVEPDRLRFDITHFEAMTEDEIRKVEKLVNGYILAANPISCEVMDIKSAKEKGATALFGEKYGNEVRVVTMGDSIELCGGTHLKNTAQIGLFKILSEGGVAAGVRRIEAITGESVYKYMLKKDAMLSDIAKIVKSTEENLSTKIISIVEENKTLEKEIHDLKKEISLNASGSILDNKIEIKGINLVTAKFDNMDVNTLRETADTLRDKTENGVVVLANITGEKVTFIATASKEAIEKGVHSGNTVREVAKIASGKGGGRPNMAQAGASDPSKVDEALKMAEKFVEMQIKE